MSMAVRVDHLAIPQPQAVVSPFGVLSDAFTQSILDRLRVSSGLYQPYLLEYLFEEAGAGYYAAPVYNIDFSLNLELLKNAWPQYAEISKERVEHIVKRLMAERLQAGQERWYSDGLSVILTHHHNQLFPRSIDNIVSSLYTSQLHAPQEAPRPDSNRAVSSPAMIQATVFSAFTQPGVAGLSPLAATPGRDNPAGIAPGSFYRPTAQPGAAGSAAFPAFAGSEIAGSSRAGLGSLSAGLSARAFSIPAAAGQYTANPTAEMIFLAATPGRDNIAPGRFYRPTAQPGAAGSAAFPALIGSEIAGSSRAGLGSLSVGLSARAFNIPAAAGQHTANPTAETIFLAATPGRDNPAGIAPGGFYRPVAQPGAGGSAAFPALIGSEIAGSSRARLSSLSAGLSARAFNMPTTAERQRAERLAESTAETIFLADTLGRNNLAGIAPGGFYRPAAQPGAGGGAVFPALIGSEIAGPSRARIGSLSAGLSARAFNIPATAERQRAERLAESTAETVFLAASGRDSLTDMAPGSLYSPPLKSGTTRSAAFSALIGSEIAKPSRARISPLSAGLSARELNIPAATGQHTANPTAETVFLAASGRDGLTDETPENIYGSIAGQPLSPAIFHRAAMDQPQAGHLSRTAVLSRHSVHIGRQMPAYNRFTPELPQRMRMVNMTRRDDISGSPRTAQQRQAYLPTGELKYVLPANLDTIHNKITDLPMPTPNLGGNGLLAKAKLADSLPSWAHDFLRQSFIHPRPPAESDEAMQKAQIRQPLASTSPSGTTQALPAAARFQQQRPAADGQMVWTAPGYADHSSVMEHRRQEDLQTPPPAHFSNAEINRMANKVYEILEDRIAREKRRLGL